MLHFYCRMEIFTKQQQQKMATKLYDLSTKIFSLVAS